MLKNTAILIVIGIAFCSAVFGQARDIGGPFKEEPKTWHHDLLRKDGSAFDSREIALIKSFNP
jgi:hypothetical protein